TGVGEPKTINIGKFEIFGGGTASVFPDGKRVFFFGKEPAHSLRAYTVEISTQKPKAITPDGALADDFRHAMSPDGEFFIARGNDQKIYVYPMGGGPPLHVSGIESGEVPFQWNSVASSVYVKRDKGL